MSKCRIFLHPRYTTMSEYVTKNTPLASSPYLLSNLCGIDALNEIICPDLILTTSFER